MVTSPTETETLAYRINLHRRDDRNKVDTKLSIKKAFVMRHNFIFIEILKNFYLIFTTIEQNIKHILINESEDDQILKQFYLEEFRRSEKIPKDLVFLK